MKDLLKLNTFNKRTENIVELFEQVLDLEMLGYDIVVNISPWDTHIRIGDFEAANVIELSYNPKHKQLKLNASGRGSFTHRDDEVISYYKLVGHVAENLEVLEAIVEDNLEGYTYEEFEADHDAYKAKTK